MITVYADILFLTDFFMTLFVLVCTRLFLKKKRSVLLCVAAALTASAGFCAVVLWDKAAFLNNAAGFCILAVITVFISYLPKKLSELIRLFMLVNCIALFTGGILCGLFFFSGAGSPLGEGVIYGIRRITLGMLLFFTAVSYIFIKAVCNIFRASVIKKQMKYTVRLRLKNMEVSFAAIGDTGNSLKDPVTGNGVIVAEYGVLAPILPFGTEPDRDIYDYISEYADDIKLRLLPYRSLGNENGVMLCFSPDSVFIDNIMYHNILIGISFIELSDTGSFRGLINTEIFAAEEVSKNAHKAA